jgi:hypothetical protein
VTPARRVVVAIATATFLSAAPAGAIVGGGPMAAVRAAEAPLLTVVGDAHYVTDTARHRIDIAVDLSILNRKSETVTRRYWYDRAYLAVQPMASGFRVSGAAGRPSVRVARTTSEYRLLEISLGRRLYSGQSMSLRLTFALRDRGGAADRFLRVGQAFVSIPVWAYASDATGGARVTVDLPAGSTVVAGGPAFAERDVAADGSVRLRSGPIPDAARFRAYVIATGEAAYIEERISVAAGEGTIDVTVRGWAEDAPWGRRLAGLVGRIVPALATESGLPGPPRLVVEEASRWAIDGGSVVFDASLGRLSVASDAPDAAILAGLAQAFLAPDVLAERWAVEGFAPLFAERAGTALGIEAPTPAWSDDLAAVAGPLNAWTAASATAPEPEPDVVARDAAARAAAVELARRLVQRVGEEPVRAALARLAAGTSVYQPLSGGGPPERADGPADWRRIVDAFEAEAGEPLDDLWTAFVTRPAEGDLLVERRAARDRYFATGAAAGDWALPAAIREALTNWRFETAIELLGGVERALAERSALADEAADLDLRLPDAVRPLVEAGRLDAASIEFGAEDAALRAIAAAMAESLDPSPIEQLGLVGKAPAADLAAARAAFEAGELEPATTLASAARLTWEDAATVGWQRAAAIGLLGGAVILGLLALRARRR